MGLGYWQTMRLIILPQALTLVIPSIVSSFISLFKDTTLTKSEVASTERVWLRYRDAWLAFAKVKFPALSSDALMARLTRDRTAQLGDIPASTE